MKNGAALALVFGVAMFAAAACSPAAPSHERNASQVSQQDAIAPISALPPGAENRPLQPGQSGTEYMPNGLPALAPAMGVNADQLFSEKISNDDKRFKRLENAVTDLRREFDSIKPAIVRLSAVEADMEQLVTQLQTLAPAAGTPAPPGSAAIDQSAPIPDIGPMSQSSTDELLDEAPKPKKSIKTAKAAPEKIHDNKTALKIEPLPEKEVAKVAATAPAPAETVPYTNEAAQAEAQEKALKDAPIKVASAPMVRTPVNSPTALTIAPLTPAEIKAPAKNAAKAKAQQLPAAAPAAKVEAIVPVKKVASAPVKAETKTPAKADVKPAPAADQPVAITGVQIAPHDGATRIVINASRKTAFNYNIDNSEKLLMIELPRAMWVSSMQGNSPGASMAGAWSVSDDGKSVILAVELKDIAEVAKTSAKDADGQYRIVFDLKKSS